MRFEKHHIVLFLLAAAGLAASAFVWMQRTQTLQFRERAALPGFRQLVLTPAATRIDPALALQPAERTESAGKPSVAGVCGDLFSDPGSPATGAADAPIRMAVFLDYRCPYCRTLSAMLTTLDPAKVRLIYKEWPILGEPSLLAARAALAAARQGKHPAFHAKLMKSRLIPTPKLMEDVAAALGIDPAQLKSDMNTDAVTRQLERTAALAATFGLLGTPALVIERTIAEGDITQRQLERLIEDETKSPAKVC